MNDHSVKWHNNIKLLIFINKLMLFLVDRSVIIFK